MPSLCGQLSFSFCLVGDIGVAFYIGKFKKELTYIGKFKKLVGYFWPGHGVYQNKKVEKLKTTRPTPSIFLQLTHVVHFFYGLFYIFFSFLWSFFLL